MGQQWRNDRLYGVGKRLSKDGTIYLGNWKKGLKHGDGIARVAHATILDPIGPLHLLFIPRLLRLSLARFPSLAVSACPSLHRFPSRAFTVRPFAPCFFLL